MKSAKAKNFFREIGNNKGRFLSIFFIVLLGTAFFAGLRSTGGDMKYLADKYYREQNLMDVRVLSTLGITGQDIEDLEACEAVETAEGGMSVDMLVTRDEELKVVEVLGMTETINKPYVEEGRLPEKNNECLADFQLVKELGYAIGDTVSLRSGTDDDIEDTLNVTEFTITGIGAIPYYIDWTRDSANIGDGVIRGFILVKQDVFELDFFTEGYLKLKGTKDLYAFSDEYDDAADAAEDEIKRVLDECAARRYENVVTDGRAEIADHKKEIEDGEKELADAKQELADGKKELEDAKQELADGKKELDDAKEEIADGWKKLADGEKELADGEAELADGRAELESGRAELESGKEKLASSRAEIESGKAELEAGKAKIASGRAEIESGKAELEKGKAELDKAREELESGRAELEAGKQTLEESRAQIEAGKAELEAGKAELAKGRAEAEAGRAALEAGRAQLESGWAQYYAGKTELEQQEAALNAGRAELEAAYAQYEQNNEEFLKSKAEYEAMEAQYAEGMAALEKDPGNEALRASMEMLRAALDAAAPKFAAAEAELAAYKQILDQKSAELDAGAAQIDQAKAEMAAAYQTLALEQAAFDENEKKLIEAEKEIEAGEKEIAENEKKLAEGEKELAAGEKKLAESEKELAAGEKELAAGEKKLAESEKQLAAGEKELETGEKEIAENEKKLADGERELINGERQIAENEQKLIDGEKEIADGERELAEGRAELDDAKKELIDGEKEYLDGVRDYEEGVLEYEDGLREWEEGNKEYNDKYDDAIEEIEDGKQKLADAEKELDDLKYPDTYVLDRGKIPYLVTFDGDADRLDKLSQVFPVIFFLVAALVSLTCMTRMVEEQRLEIGTMKALGAGGASIASKYIMYAALATLSGGIVGVFVGEKLIPAVVIDAYHNLYAGIPKGDYPFNVTWAVTAVCIAAACTIVATILACIREFVEMPAELMRPETPKSGKRVIFEYFTKFWSSLTFSRKATIRNLFRYKKRFFMTIIGIGGCMALMLVGYGIQDSISNLGEIQYEDIFRQNATVTINSQAKESEKEELEAIIAGYEGIYEYEASDLDSVILSANDRERSAYIYVPYDTEKATDYVDLRNISGSEHYAYPESGAIITEKAAKDLGISEGDVIEAKLSEDSRPAEVRVDHIVENYLMHYLYVSPETYREMFGEEPEYNQFLIKYDGPKDTKYDEKLGEALIASNACSTVQFVNDMQRTINNMLDSLNSVMWVIILCSAFLAFVVLFNLNSINITERKRELATLKVLGFHDREVAMYIYRENFILTAIGIVLGVLFGILLHRYLITTVEVDTLAFGRVINISSFLICAAWTAAFSMGVNLLMYYHFKKIDMIESLKSVE